MTAALALAGCQRGANEASRAAAARSEAIGADETIRLVGTEPFWGGTIVSGTLTYTTPENPSGERAQLRRFAGLNGFGFSGTLAGKAVDVVVTEVPCSDGMSDRRYPFSVVIQIGEDQRTGCAWTGRTPFSGAADGGAAPGREPSSRP